MYRAPPLPAPMEHLEVDNHLVSHSDTETSGSEKAAQFYASIVRNAGFSDYMGRKKVYIPSHRRMEIYYLVEEDIDRERFPKYLEENAMQVMEHFAGSLSKCNCKVRLIRRFNQFNHTATHDFAMFTPCDNCKWMEYHERDEEGKTCRDNIRYAKRRRHLGYVPGRPRHRIEGFIPKKEKLL